MKDQTQNWLFTEEERTAFKKDPQSLEYSKTLHQSVMLTTSTPFGVIEIVSDKEMVPALCMISGVTEEQLQMAQMQGMPKEVAEASKQPMSDVLTEMMKDSLIKDCVSNRKQFLDSLGKDGEILLEKKSPSKGSFFLNGEWVLGEDDKSL